MHTKLWKLYLYQLQNTHKYRQSKFTSSAPLLRELHWLPVRQRISFKILLIVYKSLCGQAPSHIAELLQLKAQPHSHSLCSSNDILCFKFPMVKQQEPQGARRSPEVSQSLYGAHRENNINYSNVPWSLISRHQLSHVNHLKNYLHPLAIY